MINSIFNSCNIKKPSFFWLATEAGRAITELGLSIPFRSLIKREANGDGHPVLVVPGFMAGDFSTVPLRNFINDLGYTSYGWELGTNFGKLQFIDLLATKLEAIYELTGEKVSVIGWSLGGVYARQLAKHSPEMVRQVITLGSPFRGITAPNNATWLYNILPGNKRIVDLDPELLADLPLPAPVPTTAIYTKEDGIVPWQVCMEEEEDYFHQNIQVHGSHLGMGVNPAVFNIILNRLHYSEENWVPFKPQNILNDLFFYPSL